MKLLILFNTQTFVFEETFKTNISSGSIWQEVSQWMLTLTRYLECIFLYCSQCCIINKGIVLFKWLFYLLLCDPGWNIRFSKILDRLERVLMWGYPFGLTAKTQAPCQSYLSKSNRDQTNATLTDSGDVFHIWLKYFFELDVKRKLGRTSCVNIFLSRTTGLISKFSM